MSLFRGDCLEILPTLAGDSVQLVLTSPPYNVGFDYGDGGIGDRRPLGEYLDFLATVLAACERVLRPGGVLALNLPPSIRTPEHRAYPLAAWAEMHLLGAGWEMLEPLVWAKGSWPEGKQGRLHAYGTAIGAPTRPYLRPTHERVLLAAKGRCRIEGKGRAWEGEGAIEWLKDVWLLPAGKAKRGEPTAFPDELVRRLVLLFSARDDVILDPFAGTGAVGRIAHAEGRRAWLIEREPRYWPALAAETEGAA